MYSATCIGTRHTLLAVIYYDPASRQLSPTATAIVSIVQLRCEVIGDHAKAFLLRACIQTRSATNFSTELLLKSVSKTFSRTFFFPPARCASSGNSTQKAMAQTIPIKSSGTIRGSASAPKPSSRTPVPDLLATHSRTGSVPLRSSETNVAHLLDAPEFLGPGDIPTFPSARKS